MPLRRPRLLRKMPAAVLAGLRRVELREVPVPEPGPGEVLVQLAAVGICGSDLHYWRCGRIGDQRVRFPQGLGHEPAGTVIALGRGVKGLAEGTRVALEPGAACGRCRYCARGRENLCMKMRFLGAPGEPGAFQPLLALPAACAEPLPPRVDFALGSAGEPLGVAQQAFDLTGLRKGERVAVLGGGPIGLCVAALARTLGARVVALSDPRPKRRSVARALGVARVTDARRAAFVEAARAGTEGYGADLVIECSGAPEGLALCVEAAARGGRVAIVGIPEADVLTVDPHVWRRKELAVVNVRRSNHTLPRCLRLLRHGDLGLSAAGFFNPPVALAKIQEAFERLDDRASAAVKVIVDPRKS